jgi:hypothetical protein
MEGIITTTFGIKRMSTDRQMMSGTAYNKTRIG